MNIVSFVLYYAFTWLTAHLEDDINNFDMNSHRIMFDYYTEKKSFQYLNLL